MRLIKDLLTLPRHGPALAGHLTMVKNEMTLCHLVVI